MMDSHEWAPDSNKCKKGGGNGASFKVLSGRLISAVQFKALPTSWKQRVENEWKHNGGGKKKALKTWLMGLFYLDTIANA
jgi:hypothetical protein